jgi:hypothetical protein
MLAGGALAHGGGGHKSKFGKMSKRGHSALKVEIRGAIKDVTTTSITVTTADVTPSTSPVPLVAPVAAPAPIEFTCQFPAGSTVTGFAIGDIVKLNCKSANGVLTAYKLRAAGKQATKLIKDRGHRGHRGFSVEVEARGSVVSADQTTITVDPGKAGTTDSLPAVTCAIGKRTRSFGTLVAGDTVKIECTSKKGVLVAKRIKKKGALKVGQIQVKVKAPITAIVTTAPASISFAGGTTCAVSDTNLLAGLAAGNFVEAKCTGNPLTLTKIHLED